MKASGWKYWFCLSRASVWSHANSKHVLSSEEKHWDYRRVTKTTSGDNIPAIPSFTCNRRRHCNETLDKKAFFLFVLNAICKIELKFLKRHFKEEKFTAYILCLHKLKDEKKENHIKQFTHLKLGSALFEMQFEIMSFWVGKSIKALRGKARKRIIEGDTSQSASKLDQVETFS